MNVVIVTFILRGSRGLTRSQYLYALNVRGKHAASFTLSLLSLEGADSILLIAVKVVLLGRVGRRSRAKVNKRGRSKGEGATTAGHWSLG